MSILEALAIAGAGLAAGMINAVVGSGTLVTFPVLLAFGLPPVLANVSNTVGLVPGSVAGAYGYRADLAGHRRRTARLAAASALGGITGAALLLLLPASGFKAVVPVFIAVALVLIVVQPWLTRWLEAHRRARGDDGGGGRATSAGLYATGVYGGYFGAAQGILLLAVLAIGLREDIARVNGLKNVLAGVTNLVAGLVFVCAARVDWRAALMLAIGSALGGVVGARIGRRLPPAALRVLVVAVGIAAIVELVG